MMQNCDVIGSARVGGGAKYIPVLDSAVCFDEFFTKPVQMWTMKVVHGIAPETCFPEMFGNIRSPRGEVPTPGQQVFILASELN
jgi:hypothetical protein